ncbi:MAG: hypothetical protein HRU26_16720 [Psychroserpens sp.]|nr:hypothetical protein [Psychroserpens sp.]
MEYRHEWRINGKNLGPPTNWTEIGVEGIFALENDDDIFIEEQPRITVRNVDFSGRAAREISKLFRKSAFQGVPIKWTLYNDTETLVIFDGYIDFTQNYRESQFKGNNRTKPNLVSVTIVDGFGLNSLLDAVNGITVDLFKDKFEDSDYVNINFVIEKKYDFLEFLVLFVSTYLFIREAIDATRRLSILIADVPTSPLEVPGYVAKVIAEAVYISFLVIQLINLAQEIRNLAFSKVRTHKGVTLHKLLTKGFEYLGYDFVTNIPEMQKYTILPTLPTKKSSFAEELFNKVRVTSEGVPSVGDWGFAFIENLTTCKRLFNARLAVINNNGKKEAHIRPYNDPFFKKQSNVGIIDNVLIDEVSYNTDELYLNRYIRFIIDSTDEWSRENKEGISFEVHTKSSPSFEDGGIPTEKGLKEIVIPYSLGERKGDLSQREKLVLNVLGFAERAINLVGGNSNFTSSIQNRTNHLKISQPEISIAKLLYIEPFGIPANHRELLGAKILEQKYWRSISFVNASDSNPFANQFQKFELNQFAFDFKRFLQLKNNSYFITNQNEEGKIDSFNWNPYQGSASIEGRIQDAYAKSLTEETFQLKNDD